MARVKRGVTKHARHSKIIKQAKGARGRQKNTFSRGQSAGREEPAVRLSRPQGAQAQLPQPVESSASTPASASTA